MPYTIVEKGEKPLGALIRRCDILKWLGVYKSTFDLVVKEGLLPSKRLIPGGVRYYRRDDIERTFLNGFRASPAGRHLKLFCLSRNDTLN
jgi:hypothetical protein